MESGLEDLLGLLKLERLELNLFRGESRDIGSPQVFGGQVLGQALSAAAQTIENRVVHSLHSYFLRPGDMNAPIVYDVDRSRDGGSFSSRRVVAIQHGRPIFNLAASFHKEETGFEHQISMPVVPEPEKLKPLAAYEPDVLEKVPNKIRRYLAFKSPFEFRHTETPDIISPTPKPANQSIWFRLREKIPRDYDLHRVLLAYVSDFNLLTTATLPHQVSYTDGNLQMASLDHAMWFHREPLVDEWLLYVCDSPSASGARGFCRGSVFNDEGVLVASTAQEGLIRIRDSR
ncbi:MAG: acyl-CoA thioesterase II [Pseudomonadota bacterium]